ncbi:MAG: tRNA (guanosine(37)-N1)-methyltransferase TrmD [Clostridiales bacterium]|nr:tRNA (guanosine(37)-N1)-methyltransferase TrmD [Clostridiales bacterium]
MKIRAITLFPKMFDCLNESIIGRAIKSGVLDFEAVDIRAYSKDKHQKCDDTPYGGGAGMVMTPQPIYDCINAVDPNHEYVRVYMSPKGERLSDGLCRTLSENENILLLCGHYEGVDQRVIDLCIDREISIGDYVLSGGELAALVVIDGVCRFVDGVLGSSVSHEDESFSDGLLEYPHYTRPPEFMGMKVPEVLLNGNHKEIDKFRKAQSEKLTAERRPDLLKVTDGESEVDGGH